MTALEKAKALNALSRISLMLTSTERTQWYVHHGVEKKDGCILSSAAGYGDTPEEAIDETWKLLTEGAPLLVIKAMGPDRREVRWNGYMWADA